MAGRLAVACALFAGACILGCSREREQPERPVVVIPDEPTRPIASRPQVQESSRSREPGAVMALERVSGEGYEGWIRPASSATSGEAWEPTSEQIAAAEAALRHAAPQATTRGDWAEGIELASYTRQYRGYRADGVDILRIDLYCADARHLASRMVTVTRGGSCFLHTAYEVTSGRFRYFAMNPD